MTTAFIVIVLVLAFIIGGMVTLLKTANKYKFPDTYDKSKTGFKDEDEDKLDSENKNNDKNNS